MKILKNIAILCAAGLVLAQCAKTESEDRAAREQAVFELWIAQNAPQAERMDNGMYVEWFRKGSSTTKISEDDFIMVDYRGRTIDGNVFSNRDSAIARHEETFTPYTRYTPHYAPYNVAGRYFTAGEYEILAQMSMGDSVRIWLPSMLAYNNAAITSQFVNGYEGWWNSVRNPRNTQGGMPSLTNRPVVIDLALRDVVADPEARELADAIAAADRLNFMVQDSIREGLFFRYIEEDATAAVIAKDSTFYMVYALRFLDDFLISTNDPALAFAAWGDFSTTRVPAPFVVNSSNLLRNSRTARHISALNELFEDEDLEVRYNSRIQLVFTSRWAYGPFGDEGTATKPVIFPYTPLMIDILILDYEYKP
ncbi:MAG: FKBP-type peptidyl-prolyl cis-trans isomerase [Rikenellaceae bacterium]|nr:FKBP-type peptidyl-prolyl cis-trans isomerase [Rikenellaceae bacterium]MCL2693200.1 FKBP-type peptidyl-prolyl cis-trans isomerase [Rikenellaceae bacterium]